MKITNIKVTAKRTKLKEPVQIALGRIDESISALVEIETDSGLVGYGEGAPGILITGETLAGTMEVLQLFKNVLIGVNPLDLEQIHQRMNQVAAKAPAAKAAIDIACYDLLGKQAQLPLYQLLGGFGSSVITDMTVSLASPSVMAQKAQEMVARGFDTLKLKVGTDASSDVERVKKIREAVGSSVKLRVDANQAWTPKEAIMIIRQLEEYQLELVEQPVKGNQFIGLAQVTQAVQTPIMADESCLTGNDALKLIQLRAVDLINIKLMKCGGIHEALRINSICESAGIECMVGCMVEETTIGVTAAAHLAAAKKNITRADLDATFSLREEGMFGGVSAIAAPQIQLQNLPGLGIRW